VILIWLLQIYRAFSRGDDYGFEKSLLEVLECLTKCNVPPAGYDIDGQ
jgi:hypothetical protein